MNDTTPGSSLSTLHLARRTFLRTTVMAAVPIAVGLAALPKVGLAATWVPPTRTRGSTRLSVRTFGALGNGAADDTAAFQAAIDALPSSGGTVYVPAGTYMIDAVKSVRLRSKLHLELAADAKLVAIANASARAYVLLGDRATDLEISGGQILGDRYRHLGTTGEWGHGIFLRGAERVTIRDIRLADCWGDGMSLGAYKVTGMTPVPCKDIVIANIVSTNNRRQALTVGRAYYVEVRDSEFSDSNGTAPETGIDVEPDYPGIAYKVNIQNCLVRGNRNDGINITKRAQGVTVRGCTIEDNGDCGIETLMCKATYIASNVIRNNGRYAIAVNDGTANCQISQNTSYGNYASAYPGTRSPFSLSGWAPSIARDINISGTVTELRITTNYYR